MYTIRQITIAKRERERDRIQWKTAVDSCVEDLYMSWFLINDGQRSGRIQIYLIDIFFFFIHGWFIYFYPSK